MYITTPRSIPRIAMVCAFGLLNACDGSEPTAPGRSPTGPRPETVVPAGEGPMLAVANSSFFDSPSNSSPNAVTSVASVEFGGIPDSTWVVVTVDGDIQQRWNPECDFRPPYWPCEPGSVLRTFGSEPWDGGPVKLWASQYGITSPIKLRGQGGSNTTSAIGLKFFSAGGGTLLGHINASPKWAWDPNYGTGPFSYYLSGGYNVQATPIPNPLEITASQPLDSLGTRRYTVQPLYGLQLINPLDFYWHPPAGAIDWYFVPGDVGSKPDWTGYTPIPDCHYQPVCEYTPLGPGRMQAAAYVETQYAVVRSENVGRPATCPLQIRGGLAGFLFGYEEGGHSWTANWNRDRVLDLQHYDHALYVPEKYDGYAGGKGVYIVSRDGEARWYTPRLSVWCYAVDKVNAWGIEYVEEHYVVVDNLGDIARIAGE